MKPVRRRKPVQVDEEALAAVKADLNARAEALERGSALVESRGTKLPATGACHDCGKGVSGERRFCGTCLAKHHT